MQKFILHHKHHLILWVILAILTVASSYFAFFYKMDISQPSFSNDKTGQQLNNTTSTQNNTTTIINNPKKIQPISPVDVYTIVDFLSEPKTENENSIIIVTTSLNTATNTLFATLEVNNQKYTLVYTNGDNLYNAMKNLQANTDLHFTGRDFGGSLGYFLEEINGIKNNGSQGKYWVYYLNGKKAKIGISNYILKFQDIITWKYEDEET